MLRVGGLVGLFEQSFELGAAAVGEVRVLGAIPGDEGEVFFDQSATELVCATSKPLAWQSSTCLKLVV